MGVDVATQAGIAERRQGGEALRKSEERYRTILEEMEEGYFETDLAGNFTFVNDAVCKHLQYSREELIGMNNRQYMDEENATKVFQVFSEIYKTGKPEKIFGYEIRRKDGTKRQVEASVSLRKDPSGKVTGFRGVTRDVTEHKKIEGALRQSEEKYRTVLESIEDGYYELDLVGNFVFFNEAMCRIYGYPKEELLGLNYKKCTSEETAKRLFQIFNEMYRTGNPCKECSYELIRKDGVKRYMGASASLIKDPSGKPIGFRGVTRDVTERKKLDEKFTNLVTHAPIGMSTLDSAGTYEYVNAKFTEIFGYALEDIPSGKQWFEKAYPDPEYRRKVLDTWKADLGPAKAGKAPPRVFTVTCKNGSIKEILFKRVALTDESHLVAYEDITDLKQAEEALRENEKSLQALMDASPIGISWADMDGNIKYSNRKFRQLFGYTVDDIPTIAAWRRLAYPDPAYRETIPSLISMLTEAQKQGKEIKPIEAIITCKDGSTRYVEQRGASASNLILAIYSDLTERKQAEEALRQSEERYRTILENMQEVYYEIDLAGNWVFLSDAFYEHLGYRPKEVIGKKSRQYQDEATARELYHAYTKVYRTGEPIRTIEAEWISKDGVKRIFEMSASLIKDSEGKPTGFRGVSRNITERKQAEEEKLSLQEQLRQSQKMEAIGQLAGGVAHDFNNLLTVIKGYSQLSLLDLKEDTPLRGNIQEIEKATQQATDLTRQLLAFSRRQILDLKVLDLNVLLKDLEKMLRRIIGEDIALHTILPEDLGKVKVDPGQIEQVIFNLAVNARDAMPFGGKLTIETANVELGEEYAHAHVSAIPGRYVRLSVSDTGVGMTQEVKEKIFEPFFTTKEKGKGTGLGLSMVYGIVKQSNGNIWVYSEPGRGTTFKIYFPRTEEEADHLRERGEADFSPRGNETVLLVEDDELVRDLAVRLLEQQGYRVLKAANGQEALRISKEHGGETIHLLLADIVMPQMGGKELCDWLKISRPNVKVLYASGYADNAIVHHGVLDPGTNFLQKPFSLKTLSHKVREVLDE